MRQNPKCSALLAAPAWFAAERLLASVHCLAFQDRRDHGKMVS